MTDEEYMEELRALREELEKQKNALIRYRRSMEDLLLNLDGDNMPAVTQTIEKYRAESADAIATVASEASDASARVRLLVEETPFGEPTVRASVIVEAINDASNVSVNADRINLNGAVTANENFKIRQDGSVVCRDLTLTGGKIEIPSPTAAAEPILKVYSPDELSSAGVYSDRVAFTGRSAGSTEYKTESHVDNHTAEFSLRRNLGEDYLQYRANLTARGLTAETVEFDSEDMEVEDSVYAGSFAVTPQQMRHTYIGAHPRTRTAGMMPLYIDEDGNIYAVRGE